ncbi:hypothetical protein BH09MYX1_BH09MYX1_51500 [soil metagenome]
MRSILAFAIVFVIGCGGDDTSTPVGNKDGGVGIPNGKSPVVAGCDILPADHPFNTDISSIAIHAKSAAFIDSIGATRALHPDWGTFSEQYGMPITTGTGASPVAFEWTVKWGNGESDKVPCSGGGGDFCYPIPTSAKIEGGSGASGGSDRHLVYLDTAGAPSACTLYEIYNAQNFSAAPWKAQNGAIFKMGTNALRPDGWTSADAAGLPILPLLARYDEVKSGKIEHALRVTVGSSFNGFIHPATHGAGDSGTNLPPMGLRLRLKSGVDVAGASAEAQVLITAMKKYGLVVADNGSSWYIQGDTNDGWSSIIDGIISAFGKVHGSDFEAVDTGPTVPQPD